MASDVATIAAVWTVVLGSSRVPRGGTPLPLIVAVVTAATIASMAGQQLYLARVCRRRAVEVSRLIRVSVLTGIAVHLVGPRFGIQASAVRAAFAAAATAVALTVVRGAYSTWLSRRRAAGRHQRPVVVVGPDIDTDALVELFEDHPELGFRAAASVQRVGDVMSALELHRSDTVVLANGAFSTEQLNLLTRRLLQAGVHVHFSTGLTGIEQRRLRAQPMAREPMFYLEPLRISPWQQAAKRAVDIVGSVVGLVLVLPVLAAAAVAIKIEDRGPVLFRHKRVGRNGEEFTIFKLRTMVPGAHRQLHLVAGANQRTGPLFKSHHDPRVTRVGRILRATSVDELPQLLNVLLGTMSLVGPRPALAHEVAQFDDDLRMRERVRPGITGLWQIEGRDDPAFNTYRKLDLFYVENWSLELDLVILLATARAVAVQALRDMRRQWKAVGPAVPVIDLAATAEGVISEGAPFVNTAPALRAGSFGC